MSLHPVSTFPDTVTDTNGLTRSFIQFYTISYDLYANYGTSLEALIACTFNSPEKAFNSIKYHRVYQYINDTVVCKIYKGYVPDHADTTADNALADGALDEANLVAQASYFCAEENFTTFNLSSGYEVGSI